VAACERAVIALRCNESERLELEVDVMTVAMEIAIGVADTSAAVFGCRAREHDLRLGLEQRLRKLATLAPSISERIRLVDRANAVRPRTWT